MMEQTWWKEGILYQIYPRSFYDSNGDGIGDLPGIIRKLDYLKNLGVTMVWLSPVYPSPNDDNGYDISNYYGIMEEFGTMEDMDELISGLHQRGLKIIMDLVVNHTSDEHPFFLEASQGPQNPYRDYYIWKKGKDGGPPTNWRSYFGGSAWEYDEKSGEYYLHLFSKKQPDLNWENPQVRKEVYKVAHFWAKKGVDGFRLDVINHLSKDPSFPQGKVRPKEKYGDGRPFFVNGPRIHEYLHEFYREVFSQYDLVTIGEASGLTPEIGALYVSKKRQELDMVIHFQIMDIDVDWNQGEKWKKKEWSLPDLKEIIYQWDQQLKEDGWNSIYLNNHDQPRAISRFADDGHYREESAKMLGTLLLTLRGTPFIYQGEELGMTNVSFKGIEDFRDLDSLNYYQEMLERGRSEEEILELLKGKSRDNARTPMQWDDSEQAGFTIGEPWIKVNDNYGDINGAKNLANRESIFHYYKRLIQLRLEHEVLVYGDYKPLLPQDEEVFAYVRTLGNQEILVLLNFTSKEVPLQLKEIDLKKTTPLMISGDGRETYLSPYEARILKIKP